MAAAGAGGRVGRGAYGGAPVGGRVGQGDKVLGESHSRSAPAGRGTAKRRTKRRTGIEPASSPWKGEALPLSYHRTGEAASVGGAPAMTVCTNDVALGDLVEHGVPVAVAQAFGDVEALVSHVVELEHNRIGLAAVSARPLAEQRHEIGGSLRDERPFTADGVRYIALAVRRVVLAFVLRSAWPAVVVALTTGLAAPGRSAS